MARRKHDHEDHVNHEAWAIPYGDLVTLLLAFFVVMYAVSSVNEGKYRVLSDSLVAAFRGTPRTFEPISIGEKVVKSKSEEGTNALDPNRILNFETPEDTATDTALQGHLDQMAGDLERAMQVLIDREMIRVRREPSWVEVEINTDILFPSGSAEISTDAIDILDKLAAVLAARNYPIRIEGHTDDRPINTLQFPSNWELSAARAARIVRLFESRGIASARMLVAGLGEHRPVGDNLTAEGRNRNRRVTLVILGTANDMPDAPGDAAAESTGITPPGEPPAAVPVTTVQAPATDVTPTKEGVP